MSQSVKETIGKGTLWYGSGNIMLKVVSITTTFVVLGHMSVYSYGLVTLVLSLVPLVGFILLPGLHEVVISDMGVEKGKGNWGKVKDIFVNFFLLKLVLSVVAWAVLFFGADIIASYYEGSVSTLIKIVSFTFLMEPFRAAMITLFSVQLKYATQSLFTTIEEIAKLAIILVCFNVFELGALGVVLAHTFATLLPLLLFIIIFLRAGKPILSATIAEASAPWSLLGDHRKWSVSYSYLGTLGNKLRLWFVKLILGTEAVGVFQVASGLYGHLGSLLPISQVVTPLIPQYIEQKDRLMKIVNKSIKYQVVGYVILAVIGVTVLPSLFVMIFPKYAGSMLLFRLFLLAFIPRAIMVILTPLFMALKAQRKLFTLSVYKFIFIIVASPILLTYLGLAGAVVEFILSIIFFTVLCYLTLRKLIPELKISARAFVEVDDDDRMIISAVLKKTRVFARLSPR